MSPMLRYERLFGEETRADTNLSPDLAGVARPKLCFGYSEGERSASSADCRLPTVVIFLSSF